jgi:hypothetical protein
LVHGPGSPVEWSVGVEQSDLGGGVTAAACAPPTGCVQGCPVNVGRGGLISSPQTSMYTPHFIPDTDDWPEAWQFKVRHRLVAFAPHACGVYATDSIQLAPHEGSNFYYRQTSQDVIQWGRSA